MNGFLLAGPLVEVGLLFPAKDQNLDGHHERSLLSTNDLKRGGIRSPVFWTA